MSKCQDAGSLECAHDVKTPFRRAPKGSASCLVLLLIFGCRPPLGVTPQPRVSEPSRHVRPPDPAAVWPPRAVWVVRQAYESPEQIAALMEDCRQAGFNTVLFQVRGNGAAFYRSRIEPLTHEYTNGDPGFDPLEVACREAHRRGLALHAWVNVMPGWRGPRPPADRKQLYHARPEWFLKDQHGKRQPLDSGFYVSLNPCLPEVRDYLVRVFSDILRRYPVDGLHLDYIRFPIEESPKGSDYPHDRRTLRLYRSATRKRPGDDAGAWTRWRTAQVTRLVRDIRQMMRRVRPRARLTAACGPHLEKWGGRFHQDGPTWLRGNLVDLVFVMNYTPDPGTFRKRQEAWFRAAPGKWIAAGLGVYLHSSDQAAIEQLRLADRWGHGFGIFSSSSLFSDEPRSRRRLGAIRPMLRELDNKAAAGRVARAGRARHERSLPVAK